MPYIHLLPVKKAAVLFFEADTLAFTLLSLIEILMCLVNGMHNYHIGNHISGNIEAFILF